MVLDIIIKTTLLESHDANRQEQKEVNPNLQGVNPFYCMFDTVRLAERHPNYSNFFIHLTPNGVIEVHGTKGELEH